MPAAIPASRLNRFFAKPLSAADNVGRLQHSRAALGLQPWQPSLELAATDRFTREARVRPVAAVKAVRPVAAVKEVIAEQAPEDVVSTSALDVIAPVLPLQGATLQEVGSVVTDQRVRAAASHDVLDRHERLCRPARKKPDREVDDDRIGAEPLQRVAARTAVEKVVAQMADRVEEVAIGLTPDDVVTGPVESDVAAATEPNLVVAGEASRSIVPAPSEELVAPTAVSEPIVSDPAEKHIASAPTVEEVLTKPATEDVAPMASADDVLTSETDDPVVSTTPDDDVFPRCADELVAPGRPNDGGGVATAGRAESVPGYAQEGQNDYCRDAEPHAPERGTVP